MELYLILLCAAVLLIFLIVLAIVLKQQRYIKTLTNEITGIREIERQDINAINEDIQRRAKKQQAQDDHYSKVLSDITSKLYKKTDKS